METTNMVQEYEFKKSEINKLFDLNQDLKHIFTEYYIYPCTNIIIGTNTLHKGQHFVLSPFEFYMELPENAVIKLNSKDIFTAINKNKKNIKKIAIYNNDDESKDICLLGDKQLFVIGKVLSIDDPELSTPSFLFEYIRSLLKNESDGIYLDNTILLKDTVVEDLVANAYHDVHEDVFTTRITKEVIPGLKKSHKVFLFFTKHCTDNTMFHLGIRVERGTCISYHTYCCLYM